MRLQLFTLALAMLPSAVQAASTTSNMNVTMTITAECTLSASGLDFGSPARASAPVDATAVITVNCTDSAPYNVAIGNGLNHDTSRRMKDGGTAYVPYQLYTNSGRSTLWEGSTTVSGTGNAANQTITVYGRVPTIGAGLPVGTYSDTVVVTLNF